MLLFVVHVDALKQFLVWMLILLCTLVFSMFEQRKMGVAYRHFAKRVSKGSFSDEAA